MIAPSARLLIATVCLASVACACSVEIAAAPSEEHAAGALQSGNQAPALAAPGGPGFHGKAQGRGPHAPVDALQWKRSGDRGMSCAELAACCPKLPESSRDACLQVVALDDESLCEVVASPYCEP